MPDYAPAYMSMCISTSIKLEVLKTHKGQALSGFNHRKWTITLSLLTSTSEFIIAYKQTLFQVT